jgi:hypothetical protein
MMSTKKYIYYFKSISSLIYNIGRRGVIFFRSSSHVKHVFCDFVHASFWVQFIFIYDSFLFVLIDFLLNST